MAKDEDSLLSSQDKKNRSSTAGEDQRVPFLKLFTFADRLDAGLMIVGTIGAIANGLTQPIMPIILGKLINAFGASDPSHVQKEVYKVSCWMVTGERQATRIRSLYLETILRQDIAFFDTETTAGEAIGRMSGDTFLIQDAMGEKVGKFIQLASTFFGGFIIAFARGWLLALVLLSCIPVVVIAGGIMSTVMSKMSSRGQVAYAEAGNVVEQTVGAIRTVASFTGEKQAIENYNRKLKIAYTSIIQQGMASGIGMGVMLPTNFGTYGLAVWYGSKLIIGKGYNGGQVINILMSLMTGGMALGQTSPSLNAFAAGKAAAYKMFETIKRKPNIDVFDLSGVVLEDVKGEIELRDVYFRYPARPDLQIFAGFSLYVASGQTAALVGQSGSGKSTVISLVQRFYDPDDGEGLDTMVGEHGTQLSGGQKQRIAIARAILKNPRILLLDEATSALDAESERIVQDALVNVMSNRTTVVVAHRLTTIRNADTIAVVHQGKIVEKGNHAELIKNPDGAYSQLVRLQDGTNEAEHARPPETHKANISFNLDKPMSSSLKRTSSIRRSISIGSTGSMHSIALSFGVPIPMDVYQTEEGTVQSQERNEVDDEKHQNVSIRRLAYLNQPEVPALLVGSIAAVVHGLGCVTLVALPVQNYFFGVAGGKLIERIRILTFEKVVHQQISWFDDPANSCGAIGARLSTDASAVRSLVGDSLALIVMNIATIIAAIFIAFTANWMLAAVVLVVSPLMFMQGYLQAKFVKGFSADAKVMYEEASQVANDAVSGIRTVASFCAEPKVLGLYQKKCEGPEKQGVRLGLVSGAGFGFSFFALHCTNALCFYFGGFLVQHGKATFGEVFKVFFALTVSALWISRSSATAPDTSKAKDSTASIFKILDNKPTIDSGSNEGITLESAAGDIDFKNVSFKYPARPDIQIFQDLCLRIPSRKTVALVGESGSGKSTVISLIQRFYNPDSGHVLLDGVEIQKFRLSWLRQQTGLVGQEPVLFNETIRDNIAYGKHGTATEDEIIAAASAANAHGFISSLPHGYDTSVGERGTQLSGGQKQRIAIARAILKNPKILLLDEAKSALDAESERIVQEALDRVMVNKTTSRYSSPPYHHQRC
ncbi:ABC transporter B family protein [Quillaja saponaria]|uniref:ABC transporter B family protein n=1 Tax=Quillaja saponaria TaxID=32244 RepID=A0AAD7M2Z2_QUISA|nr:ABC transporter B family protein [Quillaja saponaria]